VAAASGLRDEVRKAKETLSQSTYVDVRVALPVGLTRQRVTREEFERLIAGHVEHTVNLLARCVEQSGIDPNSLAAIYLVGGSSRAPIVERFVQRAFPTVKVSRRGDPKTAVALGAVLATRSGGSTDPGLVEPMPVVAVRPPAAAARPYPHPHPHPHPRNRRRPPRSLHARPGPCPSRRWRRRHLRHRPHGSRARPCRVRHPHDGGVGGWSRSACSSSRLSPPSSRSSCAPTSRVATPPPATNRA
jgi:hypothetical protein